jgi:hypothetical protein
MMNKAKKPVRPRKKHVGHPVDFSLNGMAPVQLFKTYLDFDYQKMAAYLNTSPDLVSRLKFEKAPSKFEIQKCMAFFPGNWIR